MANHGRTFSDIPDDEPVFVIRGGDRCGPHVLRQYAVAAFHLGASVELQQSVERHALAFEDWQARHGSKVPDLKSD